MTASCALGLFPGKAAADRVLFDFEQPCLYQPGFTVKDHALLHSGGLWHAFYIRGTEGSPGTSSEIELGHATSPDLHNWIIMPPVLQAGPGSWDNGRVWAPDIRPVGAGWEMYYTGVADNLLQRMGSASSTDLQTWTKFPGNPTVEPDSTIYLWSPDLAVPELSAFRDPFQFEVQGTRHLLNTALIPDSTVTAGRRGVIHHLVDDGLGGWTDVGPLAFNTSPMGAWRELESVQLVQANSKWHLFFTFFGLGGVYWVENDSLDSGWDISTAQEIDPGVGAELTPIGNGDFIFTRHGADVHASGHPNAGSLFFVLRADTLRFNPQSGVPEVIRDASFNVRWPEREGIAFLASPTFGDNAVERGDDPIGVMGHGFLSSYELYDGPFEINGAPGGVFGEGATGMIRSMWFPIDNTDSLMTFLLAGTNDPGCQVRLVERLSAEGAPLQTAILESQTGVDRDNFRIFEWDMIPWRGQTVRLEVEDSSSTGWIALDHVRMLSSDPVITSAPTPPRSTSPGELLPNHPNPFNPRTELRWELARRGYCRLELYDLRGRRVRVLEPGFRPAGPSKLLFDATGMASGTYLLRLVVNGEKADQQKLSLVR